MDLFNPLIQMVESFVKPQKVIFWIYLKNLLSFAVKHSMFDDPERSFLIRHLGSVPSRSKIVKAL